MNRGKLIVVSAPSGAGKTTIVRTMMARYPLMLFSVSATTRPQRGAEVNGKDYFFLTKEEFDRRIKAGELVEWEEIYGNYYGTLKSEVDRALHNGKIMMFDIDVKGGLSIKKHYPDDTVLIFIKPPSVEALHRRLLDRKTEDETTVARRMTRVPMELEKGNEFQYQVVNEDLKTALAAVEAILTTHTNVEAIHSSSP
ncbi:MAG: guanylate kinase [Bacteroidota bacterium]